MLLHFVVFHIFSFTRIQLYAAATDQLALQHRRAASSCLPVTPPEANYFDYMFVNAAFKSPYDASGSQMENCNCWSFATTDACSVYYVSAQPLP